MNTETFVFLFAGQLNLLKTSVLIVGCGGLGCPLAQYLAAAGVGMSPSICLYEPEKLNYVNNCIIVLILYSLGSGLPFPFERM